jgi:hypothetical protein
VVEADEGGFGAIDEGGLREAGFGPDPPLTRWNYTWVALLRRCSPWRGIGLRGLAVGQWGGGFTRDARTDSRDGRAPRKGEDFAVVSEGEMM